MTIPIGWKKNVLGERCSIEIGGTPSRNVPAYWDDTKETGNLLVSIRDLNQRVITRTAEHISDAGVKHSNVKLQARRKKRVRRYDIGHFHGKSGRLKAEGLGASAIARRLNIARSSVYRLEQEG